MVEASEERPLKERKEAGLTALGTLDLKTKCCCCVYVCSFLGIRSLLPLGRQELNSGRQVCIACTFPGWSTLLTSGWTSACRGMSTGDSLDV